MASRLQNPDHTSISWVVSDSYNGQASERVAKTLDVQLQMVR